MTTYVTVQQQEETNKYDILEKDTNVVIELNKDLEYVSSIAKKLNKGHGFNGHTPLFFAEVATPREKFNRLYKQWHEETAVSSLIEEMTSNINFMKIVEMKEVAIPYIIEQLKKEPSFLYIALGEIVNVPDNFYSNVNNPSDAINKWFSWYDQTYVQAEENVV